MAEGARHANPLAEMAPGSCGAVKWMQRFRIRWDLQLGRQQVQEIVPTEALRDKASISHFPCQD